MWGKTWSCSTPSSPASSALIRTLANTPPASASRVGPGPRASQRAHAGGEDALGPALHPGRGVLAGTPVEGGERRTRTQPPLSVVDEFLALPAEGERRRDARRVPVGGEPEHLALVPSGDEAETLGDEAVERAERRLDAERRGAVAARRSSPTETVRLRPSPCASHVTTSQRPSPAVRQALSAWARWWSTNAIGCPRSPRGRPRRTTGAASAPSARPIGASARARESGEPVAEQVAQPIDRMPGPVEADPERRREDRPARAGRAACRRSASRRPRRRSRPTSPAANPAVASTASMLRGGHAALELPAREALLVGGRDEATLDHERRRRRRGVRPRPRGSRAARGRSPRATGSPGRAAAVGADRRAPADREQLGKAPHHVEGQAHARALAVAPDDGDLEHLVVLALREVEDLRVEPPASAPRALEEPQRDPAAKALEPARHVGDGDPEERAREREIAPPERAPQQALRPSRPARPRRGGSRRRRRRRCAAARGRGRRGRRPTARSASRKTTMSPGGREHALAHRRALAGVASERDQAHASVPAPRRHGRDRPSVGASVVDDDDLRRGRGHRAGERVDVREDGVERGLDAMGLVEAGNDEGEVHQVPRGSGAGLHGRGVV